MPPSGFQRVHWSAKQDPSKQDWVLAHMSESVQPNSQAWVAPQRCSTGHWLPASNLQPALHRRVASQ